ncbi:hypothetical protein N6H18_15500 [Reichenbachiella agarivorans]|uniref:Uncharacterized protein n=1 Tax=Reichenbachiella agarivorans TaxID=2979464 RepID=A0ABY6CMP5_9BACT|nr:hypothetical protein [Reichenbachiella agarivorans]UXP31752.1 hypothetical protein N6H18_15500 [Reichenbachiella agarivorans]
MNHDFLSGFMSLTHDDIFQKVDDQLRQYLLLPLEEQINAECENMLAIIKVVSNDENAVVNNAYEEIAVRNDLLHELIDEMWDLPEVKTIRELYPTLMESLEDLFGLVDSKVVMTQSNDRYHSFVNDSLRIKGIKLLKRIFLALGQLPTKSFNLFVKEKRELHNWRQTVPYQYLVIRHYHSFLLDDLKQITNLFFGSLIKEYLTLKTWQETASLDGNQLAVKPSTMREQVLEFKKQILIDVNQKLSQLMMMRKQSFIREYSKAGTIELPSSKLTAAKTDKQRKESEAKWQANNVQWKNTIYALFEDWRSDLDIDTLRCKTLAELEDFKEIQTNKLAEYIDPDIDQIEGFIQEALDSLEQKHESIQKELKRINYQTVKQLDKDWVPQLCEKLSNQTIVNRIDKLEVTVCQIVEELSDEHIVVKSGTYDRPLREDDFTKISINELITFETLVVFENELARRKAQLFSALEKAADDAKDLDHIITFSLSSAIAALEEGKQDKEVLAIATEGFKRASARLRDIRRQLEEALHVNIQELEVVVMDFCTSLIALTENENTRELKLRITKAKAAMSAMEMRTEIQDQIKTQSVKWLTYTREAATTVRMFLKRWSGRFILTAGKPELTKQVSDFLHESRMALAKLPVVYQRLFHIEPLEDMELFEGREEEHEQLVAAFENWKLGRYGATVVLGEKWGGLTSFINHAVKEAGFSYSITRYAFEQNLSSEQDFYALMREIVQKDSLTTMDEFVDYFNQGPKRVMILEDLQNLFLRKVDGFAGLLALSHLVSRTGHHIFWITTSTIYSWMYLQRTIRLDEYFSYIIELGDMTSQQIINIVWKRNKISGYNIRFEPDTSWMSDKKFIKMTEAEQQSRLKQKFFDELNDFAKSNVSMALIFWLLSTKTIENNMITIGTFQHPNLNFLKSLDMEKVYMLHALILHDGLTVSQVSEVLMRPQSSCQLMILALLEDGVIFQEKSVYVINPIVYRGMINLLKSKNLIH